MFFYFNIFTFPVICIAVQFFQPGKVFLANLSKTLLLEVFRGTEMKFSHFRSRGEHPTGFLSINSWKSLPAYEENVS